VLVFNTCVPLNMFFSRDYKVLEVLKCLLERITTSGVYIGETCEKSAALVLNSRVLKFERGTRSLVHNICRHRSLMTLVSYFGSRVKSIDVFVDTCGRSSALPEGVCKISGGALRPWHGSKPEEIPGNCSNVSKHHRCLGHGHTTSVGGSKHI